MLGFPSRHEDTNDDRLPVLVQAVQSNDVFAMAQKVWQENMRAVRLDPDTHKEFLRFGLVQQDQAVWFERDQNRQDSFEVILTWHEKGEHLADVYVITPQRADSPSGDTNFARQVLDALLSTPATLPVDKAK